MKWVVVLLIMIILCSPVSALFNDSYQAGCGNSAVETGEDCDPPGKKCYTKDFLEGKCTKDCTCTEYTGPACGNTFIETGEDCETDNDCPSFHYCNNNCRCIAKVIAASNITAKTAEEEAKTSAEEDEKKSFEELQKEAKEEIEKKYIYEDFVVNESFFEMENFSESLGIKITGAVTKATESVFSSIWSLIKRWLT